MYSIIAAKLGKVILSWKEFPMKQKSEADRMTVPSGQWPLSIYCAVDIQVRKINYRVEGEKILVNSYQTGKLLIFDPIYYNCYEISYRYIK